MNIRLIKAKDWPAVWSIVHSVLQSESTYVYSKSTTSERAKKIWWEDAVATYVVEDEGQILGTYYIKTNQPDLGSHICNCGYMTHEAARGRGVGRKMCEHSLQAAKKMGFMAMQYNLVVSTNERAVSLWKSYGFTIVGTIPKAFHLQKNKFVDAFVMYREL